MTKFKMPLQKELLRLGETMVFFTGDTPCPEQGLCIDVYAFLRMQHGKVSCLFIVNDGSHLLRELMLH